MSTNEKPRSGYAPSIDLRECTNEELEQFVKNYPVRLETDVARMFDPPLLTYNDFSDGKVWPESAVAQVILGSERGEKDTYFLRVRQSSYAS